MLVNNVREMPSKKSCKYGEYESFVHMFFFIIVFMKTELFIYHHKK